MVRLNRDKIRRVLAGVDWGFTNPGVLQVWAVDSDHRMFLVYEDYMTHQTIDWWIGRARRVQAHFAPEVFVCDPAEPGFIAQFNQAGLTAIKAYNDIALGIQAVQMRLRIAPDGLPRIFVSDAVLAVRDERLIDARKPYCTAHEFEVYVWPRGADGRALREVPVDDQNHGMDVVRYVTCYVDGVSGAAWTPDDVQQAFARRMARR